MSSEDGLFDRIMPPLKDDAEALGPWWEWLELPEYCLMATGAGMFLSPLFLPFEELAVVCTVLFGSYLLCYIAGLRAARRRRLHYEWERDLGRLDSDE